MDEKLFYEKQYGKQNIIRQTSFPRLRKILSRFDAQREDLAYEMLEQGDKFLDVGCGEGQLVIRAKTKYNQVYGIDISESRINRAKENAKGAKEIHFLSGNINSGIQFSNNTFDAVACIDVLEHIFDPYFLLAEINRILKSEGYLILEVPNLGYIRRRLELLFGKFPRTSSAINWREVGWDGGHLHYFTYSTFCQLLKDSGFRIMKLKSSGLFGEIKSCWPSLLAGSFCVKAIKE